MRVKNYVEKRMIKMFLTEDEVLRSLTLLIFTVGWALCGRPQPEHESMLPLLSLSLLNVLTNYNFIVCQETS